MRISASFFKSLVYTRYLSRIRSEYLFEKHNVSSIRLDTDPSNEGSMMVANACGYMLDEEEYESRNYIGKMQFVRDSTCYVSKRRK